MGDTYASDQAAGAGVQDGLRTLRAFVGAFQSALGSDQSMAGTDAVAYNPPRQFVVIGTQGGGMAVEGQPITTSGGALVLPSWMVWLGLGAAAWALLKH